MYWIRIVPKDNFIEMVDAEKKDGDTSPFFESTDHKQEMPTTSQSSPRSEIPSTPLSKSQAAKVTTEIEASDEGESDNDFSDDSLEDLSTLLGRREPHNTTVPKSSTNHSNNPYTTPKAKRTALGFHSSPLAIIPKHKFDLKALAKHAKKDNATQASWALVDEARTTYKEKERMSTPREAASANTITEVVNADGTQDAHKVLRAVQRADSGQTHIRYCFFDTSYTAPEPSKPPREAMKAPWSLLTKGDARAREQNLASGVPHTILQKQGSLPDSVFEWILDEVTVQQSSILRQEYRNIIKCCPEQIERLMDEQTIERLLLRLGAAEDIKERGSELAISMLENEPYADRRWTCLESFIILLGQCSNHLSFTCIKYTAQMLLRMTMDKLIVHNPNVLMAYEETIKLLTATIPYSSWDAFCFEICSSLKSSVQLQRIKVNAVVCLPISCKRTHDLRRRLAIGFLFDDAMLARSHPEDVVTMRDVLNLIRGDDFSIRQSTDFAELQASVLLLDVAIDDGSIEAFVDDEVEKQFNKDVDALAAKLREIWRKINDSGMKLARTEAKSVVEWVQQRLSHSVRTRRVQRKSIFDFPGQDEERNLPKQQEFMNKFFKKEREETIIDEDTIVVKGG